MALGMFGMQKPQFAISLHRIGQSIAVQQSQQVGAATHCHVLAVVDRFAAAWIAKRSRSAARAAFRFQNGDFKLVRMLS